MAFFQRDFEKEFQQLQAMVEESFKHLLHRHRSMFLSAGVWEPCIDIYETTEAIVILAELAGVRKADLRLVVEENLLTISGYRENHVPADCIGCAQLEIDYGKFVRTVPLPRHIDREGISVTYQDGLLRIVVPREKGQRARRIEIE
ncbi:MAG: Hsp20/alpha crystallin family protein [Nitrospinota bacterium]|nr:MAG: Hsp20/alpha crystallin family protein [Nitrospinota bacterium]